MNKRVNDIRGVKETDTGLAPPSMWDVVADKEMMQSEQPLQVARCTKILNAGQDDAKYMINVKQIAKFVVGLGDRVAPTDIEVGPPPCLAGFRGAVPAAGFGTSPRPAFHGVKRVQVSGHLALPEQSEPFSGAHRVASDPPPPSVAPATTPGASHTP